MKNNFFENKKVLVTGGAGVIGRELVNYLKEQNAIIRVVDMAEKPSFLNGIEYFRMDLSIDCQFLFRFDPEYVFHLAADFERSEETEEFWESNFRNNIIASHNLIKNIINKKSLKKVVFASSYLIYDKDLYNDISKQNLLSENSRIEPRNLTGIAKLQTEMDLEFLSKNKFDYTSARIYRVYGRGSRDIISRWARNLLDQKEIEVFDEENKFDYIFAGDVAMGLLKLCESKSVGTYNLGFGQSRTVKEVLDIFKNELGEFSVKKSSNSIFKESSLADISKLKKEINWQPETSLEMGIKKIIEYEKSKNE